MKKTFVLMLLALALAVSPVWADTKISALIDGTGSITGTDQIPIARSGSNFYITPNSILGLRIVQAGANNILTYTGNYSLGLTLTGNTAVTVPTSGTLATTAQFPTYTDPTGNALIKKTGAGTNGTSYIVPAGLTQDRTVTFLDADQTVTSIAGSQTLTNKTLTAPVINGATGTGGAFTGNLTGLMPPHVLTIASGVHDGADDAATLTDSGESFTTSQFVGMTIYNITDGSSCTVTANNGTTITCTLAGGTDNNWDTNDVWQVGPGPSQSGSSFWVTAASTIRHPATVGYAVEYGSPAAAKLTVDMAADTMIFTGVLDAAVVTLDAGDSIDSSGSTTADFMMIHNISATQAFGHGKRGTWADGGAS